MFSCINLLCVFVAPCVQNLHSSVSQYALQSDANSHSSTVNESGFVSLDQPNHVFRCVSIDVFVSKLTCIYLILQYFMLTDSQQ